MTEAKFMGRLRSDAIRQLALCETATRLLPEDIRDQTLERRIALRGVIREFDQALRVE